MLVDFVQSTVSRQRFPAVPRNTGQTWIKYWSNIGLVCGALSRGSEAPDRSMASDLVKLVKLRYWSINSPSQKSPSLIPPWHPTSLLTTSPLGRPSGRCRTAAAAAAAAAAVAARGAGADSSLADSAAELPAAMLTAQLVAKLVAKLVADWWPNYPLPRCRRRRIALRRRIDLAAVKRFDRQTRGSRGGGGGAASAPGPRPYALASGRAQPDASNPVDASV